MFPCSSALSAGGTSAHAPSCEIWKKVIFHQSRTSAFFLHICLNPVQASLGAFLEPVLWCWIGLLYLYSSFLNIICTAPKIFFKVEIQASYIIFRHVSVSFKDFSFPIMLAKTLLAQLLSSFKTCSIYLSYTGHLTGPHFCPTSASIELHLGHASFFTTTLT